jgi:hypothetical protein
VQEGQALVNRALKRLVAEGIVDSCEERYWYNATPRVEEFCQKLFTLYEKVLRRRQMELLAPGLLSQVGGRYLLRMDPFLQVLEKEGFTMEDVTHFLDEEIERGYVKRVRVIFIARASLLPPLFVPSYYASHLHVNTDEYEQLKERCYDLGLSVNEEDYLIGDYPAELAEPAIQYMETEKQEVIQALKEEPFPVVRARVQLVARRAALQGLAVVTRTGF